MKQLYTYLFLILLLTPTICVGQSLEVIKPFEKLQYASVLAVYNDYFQKWENPNEQETFPYAVIRVILKGNQHEVLAAKKHLGLYLGEHSAVETTIKDIENTILFLVPCRAGTIMLTCGQDCSPIQVIALNRLESNAVYEGILRYMSCNEKTSSVIPDSTLATWCNIGNDYYYGKNNKPQDYVQAVEWYRKSAEQGNMCAQYNLGLCYEFGRGVVADISEAKIWYHKAANQGDAEAQCQLANYYYSGGNGSDFIDYIEAVKWYRKSASQGNMRAQYKLGLCYECGYGVDKSLSEARFWYQKAADQNFEKAKKKIELYSSLPFPNTPTRVGNLYYKALLDNKHSVEVTTEGFNYTYITIPKKIVYAGNEYDVMKFDVDEFVSCDNLTKLSVEANHPIYDSRENCNAVIETETNTLIAGCKNTVIPNSVTTIGDRAFFHNNRLISIAIPCGVTKIGNEAFCRCYNLTSINLPSGLTNIGDETFRACDALNTIIIPTTVKSIGDYAFFHCDNLKEIYYQGTKKQWNRILKGEGWKEKCPAKVICMVK